MVYFDLRDSNARRKVRWVSVALAFASGIGWFLAVVAAIDGSTPLATLSDGTAATVISDTQFGEAWTIRFLAGALLAVLMAFPKRDSTWFVTVVITVAAILVGGLAFAGDAASSPGLNGDIHLTADILHLVAAGAWLGGLLPYLIFLWKPKSRADRSGDYSAIF